MTITVRPASLADIPWLLTELIQFDQFYGTARTVLPSMEYAETTLRALIAEQVFLVADTDGGPAGFIAGIVTPHLFNPALTVLSEIFWWVPVAARGGRVGAELLASFIAIGKTRADWIIMTLEANSPVDPSAITRLGFRAKETNFLLEVPA